MIKVKLKETYKQPYWDSSTGVTVARGEVAFVDESNSIVRHALDTNILEVVVEQKDELKIISDIPSTGTISEVMTESKIKSNKEAINKLKENASTKPSNKADKL